MLHTTLYSPTYNSLHGFYNRLVYNTLKIICICESVSPCTCVCTRIEIRGQPLESLFRPHPHCFLKHSLSVAWGQQIRLGWPASEPVESACLPFPWLGLQAILTITLTQLLHTGSGDRTQVLMLARQALYLRYLPSPILVYNLAEIFPMIFKTNVIIDVCFLL